MRLQKMKNILLTFLLYFSIVNVIGQKFSTEHLMSDSAQKSLSLHSMVFTNSNSLSGKFMRAAAGFTSISNEDMQQSLNDAKSKNTIGYELRSDITFKTVMKDSTTLAFTVGYLNSSAGSLSEDAYKLALNGNYQFMGETAILNPSQLNFYQYGYLGVGLIKEIKNGWQIAGYVNFILGEKYIYSNINEGALHTSEIGDSLHLLLDGQYKESEGAKVSFDNPGGSVDLMITKHLNNKKNSQISIGVLQLGAVQFKEATAYNLNINQSLVGQYTDDPFNGFNFDNFDQLRNDIDSIAESGTSNSEWVMTPANVFVDFQNESEKLNYGASISYLLNGIQNPYANLNCTYKTNSKLRIGGNVGFGGYSIFNIGAVIGYTTGNMNIVVGSQNLEGILLPNSFGGNNFFMNLNFLMP